MGKVRGRGVIREYRDMLQRGISKNGKRKGNHIEGLPNPEVLIPIAHLPMLYAKYLTKTLTDAVNEQLGKPPDEQLQIYEEIALVRIAAGEAVKMFANADAITDATKREKALSAIIPYMTSTMQDVAKLCESGARISAATQERLSVQNVQYIVHQLCRMMYEVCGPENEHIARRFKELVDTELSIINADEITKGTTLTPDKTVTDMDGTIPRI